MSVTPSIHDDDDEENDEDMEPVDVSNILGDLYAEEEAQPQRPGHPKDKGIDKNGVFARAYTQLCVLFLRTGVLCF